MKREQLNNDPKGATNIVAQEDERRKSFDEVKRRFETAYASGKDYSAELLDLAQATAYSVINKCIDPQRKTAVEREDASASGCNPLMIELKQGMGNDRRTLDGTRRNADKAMRVTFDKNGDCVTEVADKAAEDALNALIRETLSDGIDLIQEAALAILAQAKKHAQNGEEWLDKPHTVRRLSKRVYIRDEKSAAYRDEETTPIQEVFRAVRVLVQNSRAVQTDPRNGYSYIEDMDAGTLETIYFRMGKYADIGGYDCMGNYTTPAQNVADYYDIMERLDLTPRQREILELRMQGKGYKAIATYFGITSKAVKLSLAKVQSKAEKIGFTPETWLEMTGNNVKIEYNDHGGTRGTC